jgi:predicted dehydrogenase
MVGKQLSVAVIGAGMAGRSRANGYRQAPTVFGPELPAVRLATIADADLAARTLRAALAALAVTR